MAKGLAGALYEALQTAYTGSALDTKTNGLWVGLAAPATVLPYISIAADMGMAGRDTGRKVRWEIRTLQFSIFAAGPGMAEIEDLKGELVELFDDAVMTFSVGVLCSLRYTLDHLIRLPDEEGGGWEWIVEFEALLSQAT